MKDDVEFYRVLYRALTMLTAYLERRYGFGRNRVCPQCGHRDHEPVVLTIE